jgi:peptidoglycan/LPS O-acetylase OafA/YrhL
VIFRKIAKLLALVLLVSLVIVAMVIYGGAEPWILAIALSVGAILATISVLGDQADQEDLARLANLAADAAKKASSSANETEAGGRE